MTGSGQPRFLVMEGQDGSGTTTVSEALAEALRARDLQVCLTAEPSDGPLGLVARAFARGELALDPATAALAFTADRADHLGRIVRPALASGAWVVSDRYLLSTLAYQGADGVDQQWILAASSAFEVPDLTIVLMVSEAQRRRRIAARSSVERYEAPAAQDAIREGYRSGIQLLLARGHPIEVVDASGPVDEVLQDVLERVDALP